MDLKDYAWTDLLVKSVAAILIIIVTAILAKVLSKLVTKALSNISALQRTGDNGTTLAASLGKIVALVIWLFGLMAVLNLFKLEAALAPLQDMLSSLLGALPRILGAGLVLFIGFILAKVARDLLVTALQAANVDKSVQRLQQRGQQGSHASTGPDDPTTAVPTSDGIKVSTMLGQLVYVIIILVVAISALQVLAIESISQPATEMLSTILNALPLVLGAGILLGIGVMIARLVGQMLEGLLRGFNLNNAVQKMGVENDSLDVPATLSRVAQVAIVLFFAVAATKMLNFPQITEMLNTVLNVGGRVVFGLVVIAAGVFLAKLVASFLSGNLAVVAQYATIVLFAAIGLSYMGLADSIINLAFGALVVGGALAAALAFGLGGREAAGRQLERWQRKQDSPNA